MVWSDAREDASSDRPALLPNEEAKSGNRLSTISAVGRKTFPSALLDPFSWSNQTYMRKINKREITKCNDILWEPHVHERAGDPTNMRFSDKKLTRSINDIVSQGVDQAPEASERKGSFTDQ